MKRLIIDATGSSAWIGGVYHKKNMVFSLLRNDWIRDNCRIVLVTDPDMAEVFREFETDVKLVTVKYDGVRQKKIKLALTALRTGCRYVFPCFDVRICRLLGITGINWIPDYQHYHYPEFFTDAEKSDRRMLDLRTVDDRVPLVLSSNDCLSDFRQYVSGTKQNIYIVPFVSYIEKEVREISEEYLNEVCKKIAITPYLYACVSNQFWQHKNHKVVLEALKCIADRLPEGARFVFTGKLSDYRDGGYADEIRGLLDLPELSGRCVCTGFIDRREQLALMHGARFIIQPSLFEGWGTVVEDAKVLDKTILLSDIPVHHEQMNDKCTLFDPRDPQALGELILDSWSRDITDDVEAGIIRMHESAIGYSREFERLLKEN
ncbi:MAG: glycosyltransferase [Lachnospiraceae bacterium]|nr:glycosyltransferase [Lachnospiraceae bacterium]MBQ8947848.1 glycosyltransferase [Lachnospiraceae bacterium]